MSTIQFASDVIQPVRSVGNGNSGGVYSIRNVSEKGSVKDADIENAEGPHTLKQEGDIKKKQASLRAFEQYQALLC